MSDRTSLLTSSNPIATDVVPGSDRRSSPRIDCLTVVTAVVPNDTSTEDKPQVIKAYSQDVSVGGAKLISQEPLPSKRLFLRFLLPAFGDHYVEAEVVSEKVGERRSLRGRVTQHYVYGVRFTGLMTDDDMINETLPTPATRTAH